MVRTLIAMSLIPIALLVGGCGQSDEEKAAEQLQETLADSGFGPDENDVRSKEEVRSWPEKFCTLKVGQTRDEVRAIMGEPTDSFSDSTANQDGWDGYGIALTAFYDVNDRVTQLQDSTGEANLPCEEVRS